MMLGHYLTTQVILAGFAEQSKTSVVHMCSLFHSFILSQLWTVYLEYVTPTGNTKASTISKVSTVSTISTQEEQLLAPSILLDFWVKVTPGILQLVSHSKVDTHNYSKHTSEVSISDHSPNKHEQISFYF